MAVVEPRLTLSMPPDADRRHRHRRAHARARGGRLDLRLALHRRLLRAGRQPDPRRLPRAFARRLRPRGAHGDGERGHDRRARLLERVRRRQPRARARGRRALRHRPRPRQRDLPAPRAALQRRRCRASSCRRRATRPTSRRRSTPRSRGSSASAGTAEEERRERLFARVEELLDAVDMPRSLADLGIARAEFDAALPDLAAQPSTTRASARTRVSRSSPSCTSCSRPASAADERRPALPHPSRRSTTAPPTSTTASRWRARRRPTGSRRSARRRTSATTTTCAIDELAGPRRRAQRRAARRGDRRARRRPAARSPRRWRRARPTRSCAPCRSAAAARWILLEPAPGPAVATRSRTRRRARARAACAALIAHPERHLARRLRRAARALVGRGALVQATAALLADAAGRRRRCSRWPRAASSTCSAATRTPRAPGGRWRSPAPSSALAEVDALRAALDWIAREAPRGDRRAASRSCAAAGARPRPARRSSHLPDQLLDHLARARAEAVAQEVRGAGRRRRARSVVARSRAPRASPAASAPIIESPQPSREPRSKRGGTSSHAPSPLEHAAPARRRG